MPRQITLFTGQWTDLPLDTIAEKAAAWGYDGLELACGGDHFDVGRALDEDAYCDDLRARLDRHGLDVYAISNHLVGQAVCDRIDDRHRAILPPHVWGDGDEEGVRRRAADEMIRTARAAARFGARVVTGFTGSSIWPLLYSFPPVPEEWIEAGFRDFADRWTPILDAFGEAGVKFALEVHPTEIAFDTPTARRALTAVEGHPAFGFNLDPSHFAYQGVDYIGFIQALDEFIHHVHLKDVWWAEHPGGSGVFGGHLAFGDVRRGWDFRSPGRGRVDFDRMIRALNTGGYTGPLSVEWEDSGMDREHGAREALEFARRLAFPASEQAFDAAFKRRDPTGR